MQGLLLEKRAAMGLTLRARPLRPCAQRPIARPAGILLRTR
jgi:hypothetical protein